MVGVSGSAAVVAVSAIAPRVSVRHTGGWGWESRWLFVTKYLARLNEIYASEKIDSNTDLWAIVNSFMVDCHHLGDVFAKQLGLKEQVRLTRTSSAELELCRDYANVWKHFRRDGNVRVAYIWEDGDSESGGHYVTIGHRLRDDPDSAQTLVDSLEVARAAWEAWRVFMLNNNISEPTGLTQPYLDKLLAE